MTEQSAASFSPTQHNQQLALAVTLVNSKPPRSSVKGRSDHELHPHSCISDIFRDYIHQVRQALVSDSTTAGSSELKALRDEIRQLQNSHKILQDENKVLKDENQNLRQQYRAIPGQGGSSEPKTKRKRSMTDVLPTPIESAAAFILEDLETYLPSTEGYFHDVR